MPLILLSGYPCAGKTHRATQLTSFLQTRISSASAGSRASRLTAALVSDHSLGVSRHSYEHARMEKEARGVLASAIRRALGRDVVVVVDAPNYIKGFRYQMYCEAKAVGTPSCVIHIGAPAEQCRKVNEERIAASTNSTSTHDAEAKPADGATSMEEAAPTAPEESLSNATNKPPSTIPADSLPHTPYPPDLFENLIFRYEEPNGMTRWDSPLFFVPHDDADPPYEAIWNALVGSEGAPVMARPNAATVLPSANSSDALYALEKAAQDVVSQVAEWAGDHPGEAGGEVRITAGGNDGGEALMVHLPTGKPVAPAQLQRLRRQFVGLYRTQAAGLQRERMAEAFVGFLNDAWENER